MYKFITPNWQAPSNVYAYTTTKLCSLSKLQAQLILPNDPIWLDQQHTSIVIEADKYANTPADGIYTRKSGIVCAVRTADCLPILLCNVAGNEIAALHGGWRGLADNIIAYGVAKFMRPAHELMAWLGPAISGKYFEVGEEVKELFISKDNDTKAAFYPAATPHHAMLDLYQVAKIKLHKLGVTKVYGGEFCTYTDQKRFFSYRRGDQVERMITLIWFNNC